MLELSRRGDACGVSPCSAFACLVAALNYFLVVFFAGFFAVFVAAFFVAIVYSP